MGQAFTIRIFVQDGDPEGVRVIDRMNWTGVGLVFPREKWKEARQRPELDSSGVYMLVGYSGQHSELPTIYIGQAEAVKSRIESHVSTKDFWSRAVVFVSKNGSLNRAHVTWLESALIRRAAEAGQCHLDNGNTPQEPTLSEWEKADIEAFLNEMLQILPLVELRVFERPKVVAKPEASDPAKIAQVKGRAPDTIIVPAKRLGFERTFIGKACWYAVRISGGMLDKIKYIAAYQTQPISAITHYAPVSRIETYGETGKYKLVFSEEAKLIGPIPYGDAPSGAMQGPRYTTFAKLQTAKTLNDLL